MRIRGTIIILLTIYASSNAQNPISISAAVGTSYSWFDINEQSRYDNNGWETTKNTFSPKFGYSFGLGVSKPISKRFTLSLMPRWQYWGGAVKIKDRDIPFYIALDIAYHSFRIPLMVDYRLYQLKNWSFSSNAGLGIDYTYDLTFYPSSVYGTGNVQKRNVGITSPFIALGLNITYRKNTDTRFAYQLALNFETDHLLNPDRFNEFLGLFGHKKIPLNSHMTNAIFKLLYRL